MNNDSTNADLPPTKPSYVKMMRSPDLDELMETAPLAFVLAAKIARRACFQPGISLNGLQPGEAFVGDFKKCGLSERQYRAAKEQLSKWGFATFKPTNKGTIARLIDTRDASGKIIGYGQNQLLKLLK
jgi:hypothetical protein